jgi:hypothetical protein
MAATPTVETRLKVFISYSRKDLGFAQLIVAALEARGLAPTIDTRDLPKLEDWRRELLGFIRAADAVVFIVSPNSISSPVCTWEVEQVAKLNKRLAPIVLERVPDDRIPEAIAKINYLFFDSVNFDVQADELARALQTDLSWLKEHTRLGELARRWDEHKRASGWMLRGQDLQDAERWIASRPRNAPESTASHREFIVQSRRGATRRQRLTLAGSLIAAIVGLGLAGLAYWQRGIAVEQTAIAVQQRGIAIDQRNQALLTQSQFLVSASTTRRNLGDVNRAMALALEALPSDVAKADRPYVPQAEMALRLAYRDWQGLQFRQSTTLSTPGKLDAAVLSPDGTVLAVASPSVVSLREANSGAEIVSLSTGDENVWAIDFFPKGDRLIFASKESLRVWDLNEQKYIFQVSAETGKQICGWSYDNKDITAGITSAETHVGQPRLVISNTDFEQNMLISAADCSLLGPQAVPWILNSAKYEELRVGQGNMRSAIVNAQLEFGIMDNKSGFNMAPGNKKYVLASLSPDGRQVATVTEDGNIVIWNIQNLAPLAEIKTNHVSPTSMNFSSDGQKLLTGFKDNGIVILNRASLAEFTRTDDDTGFVSDDAQSARVCGEFSAGLTAKRGNTTHRLLLDQERVTLETNRNGKIANNIVLFEDRSSLVRDMMFSSDGQKAILTVEPNGRPQYKSILVFSADTGSLLFESQGEFGNGTRCVRVSQDLQRIAIIDDVRMRLVDFGSGRLVREVPSAESGDAKFVSAAFSANARRLALYLSNGRLILVDAESGVLVDEFQSTMLVARGPVSFFFDPSDSHLLADSGSQRYSWSIYPSTMDLVSAAKRDLVSCIAPNERRSFSLSDDPPEWCVALGKPPYDDKVWQDWLRDKKSSTSSLRSSL